MWGMTFEKSLRMFYPGYVEHEERACHKRIAAGVGETLKIMRQIEDNLKVNNDMDKYVTLVGAEGVARAGSEIGGAADRIERAAASFHESMMRFQQTSDTLERSLHDATSAVEKLTPLLERLASIIEKQSHFGGN